MLVAQDLWIWPIPFEIKVRVGITFLISSERMVDPIMYLDPKLLSGLFSFIIAPPWSNISSSILIKFKFVCKAYFKSPTSYSKY